MKWFKVFLFVIIISLVVSLTGCQSKDLGQITTKAIKKGKKFKNNTINLFENKSAKRKSKIGIAG